MSNFFFGQNVYKVSAKLYNIDVDVSNPWSLAGDTVTFVLKQGSTQIASATRELEVDIESNLNDLFKNVSLSAGNTYTVAISEANYQGSQNFSIGTSTDIQVQLNVTETVVQSVTGNKQIGIEMEGVDVQTNSITIRAVDSKDEFERTYDGNDDGMDLDHNGMPGYAGACFKVGNIGEFSFDLTVTLDSLQNERTAVVKLINSNDDEIELEYWSDTDYHYGYGRSDQGFFSDVDGIKLYIEIIEPYSL